jgi:SAM-dependent methyltransferase
VIEPTTSPDGLLPDAERRAARTSAIAAAIRSGLGEGRHGRGLDIGTGQGGTSPLLADLFDELVLVDVDAVALETARRSVVATGTPVRPALVDLSAESPELDPASLGRFDVAYTVMSAHHVRDLPRLLVVVAGLLRPGGRLFVADLEPDGGAFHAHMADFDGHDGFDAATLTGWLTDAGLQVDGPAPVHVDRKLVAGAPHDFPIFLAVATRTDA